MGKFKDAMRTTGKVLDAWAEQSKKVDMMTDELMRRTYNVDRDQARRIASTLVTQADITWK